MGLKPVFLLDLGKYGGLEQLSHFFMLYKFNYEVWYLNIYILLKV